VDTPEGPRPLTTYYLEQNTFSYSIAITEYSAPFESSTIDQTLELVRDSVVQATQGKLVSSKLFELQGKRCLEYAYTGSVSESGNGPGIEMAGYTRLFIIQNKLIVMGVIGPAAKAKAESAKLLWDTVSITGP
jgi:hypothetical protein